MEKYQRSNILKNSHYFDCKNCINRISDIWDEQSTYTIPETDLGDLLVFKKVIKENVVIQEDEESPLKVGPHTVALTNCKKCKELIGYKFIAGPTPVLKEGDFLFIPKKLKLVRTEEAVDEEQGAGPSQSTGGELQVLEAVSSSRNTEGEYESLMINEGGYKSSQENLGRERFGCCSGITGTGWCSQQ